MPAPELPVPAPEQIAELARLPVNELAEQLERWQPAGEAALPLLHALDSALRDPAARKLVRRALHRLRSSGVGAAPPAAKAGSGSVLRPVRDDRTDGALIGAPDAEGLQPILAVLADPSRRWLALELWLHGELGVRALRAVELERSQARRTLRSVERSERPRWARLPLEQAGALVARAQRRSAAPAAGVDPGGLALLLRAAGPLTPGEALRARFEGAQPLPRAESEATLAARLHADRVPPWRIGDPETWAATARELESFEHSQIILSPAQQRERRDRLLRELWLRLFDEAGRARLADRLEEAAAVWWSHGVGRSAGDAAAAQAALAVALRLREEADVERVAFARECFESSLRAAVSAAQAQQHDRLVVPG